jgi:hypothetical protein
MTGAGIQTGAISARSMNEMTNKARSMGPAPDHSDFDLHEPLCPSSGCVKFQRLRRTVPPAQPEQTNAGPLVDGEARR